MNSILLEHLEISGKKMKRGQEMVPALLIDKSPELTPGTNFTNPQ